MAATDSKAFGLLAHAALALPISFIPAKAAAAEVGEVGINVLAYRERGLMSITEPVLWARAQFLESWEVQASVALDTISGASPQLVTNESGKPVQTVSGASIDDRRYTGDARITRRLGDFALTATGAWSEEEDYRSHAYGFETRYDLNQRNTTLVAGYAKSNDRVRSTDDPRLNAPRVTEEYLAGVTQVIDPTSLVQTTLAWSRGKGWYNDPYKLTFTFFPAGPPILAPDRRPDHRNSLAWLTRYRKHFAAAHATLQAEYRYFRDDWGIRAHTFEAAWQQEIAPRWSLRPALRYYTQDAADFYSPVAAGPSQPVQSSDQRLASFGGLSPSLRAILRVDDTLTLEATVGYVYNARNLHFGGAGSDAFTALRAYYGLVGVTRSF